MVAGWLAGAAGTVVIQNGFKPIYGFEWTPKTKRRRRRLVFTALPSNSQILFPGCVNIARGLRTTEWRHRRRNVTAAIEHVAPRARGFQ